MGTWRGQVEEKLLDCLVGPSNIQHNREAFRKLLRMGHLDDRLIEIEVPERKPSGNGGPMDGGNNQFPMNEIILRFDKMMHKGQKTEKREMPLKECVLSLDLTRLG
jgi:ATP-dependent protease HslVU (ClpYQ) ATPase subunit